MNFIETLIYLFCYWCGPIANKFGQILSARSDYFTKELIEKLSTLRNKCQCDSNYKLGILPKEIKNINPKPINAGTICVILSCTYKGKPAILKVRKSKINLLLSISFWFLLKIVYIIEFFSCSKVNLYQKIKTLHVSFIKQTNLKYEAKNQEIWYKQYNGELIGIPKIYYSTEDFICMEYIKSVNTPIKEIHAFNLYYIIHHSMFCLGLLHADLHPGNILFNGEKFIFIDFGWCVNLTDEEKLECLTMNILLKNKNYSKLAKFIVKTCFKVTKQKELADLLQIKLQTKLKKRNFFKSKYTVSELINILVPFGRRYGLNMKTKNAEIEAAMINIDSIIVEYFPDICIEELRDKVTKAFTLFPSVQLLT